MDKYAQNKSKQPAMIQIRVLVLDLEGVDDMINSQLSKCSFCEARLHHYTLADQTSTKLIYCVVLQIVMNAECNKDQNSHQIQI